MKLRNQITRIVHLTIAFCLPISTLGVSTFPAAAITAAPSPVAPTPAPGGGSASHVPLHRLLKAREQRLGCQGPMPLINLKVSAGLNSEDKS